MKNKAVAFVFVGFIGFIGLFNILIQDRPFSQEENRPLAQMPTFTWKSFASGTFTKQFETYLSDQFVGKEMWTAIKSRSEQVLLKQENNGIFLGKDGYLLEPYQKPGEQFQNNLNELVDFAHRENELKVSVLLAPNSVAINHDKLPRFAQSIDQQKVLLQAKEKVEGELTFIDVYDTFVTRKEEALYYKTDHHWTTKGAFYAYQEVIKSMGITPMMESDFIIKEVSTNFYGTYYSKVHDNRLQPDIINIYEPKEKVDYEVFNFDGNRTSKELYEWEHLKKRDQYSLFLGGNHSLITIKSSIQNGKKIAVIKDSYAHAFVPFLVSHFEEVHMIDLRYNHNSVHEYIKENKIENVLFLYNLDNFSTDTNFGWLKR